MEVTPWSHTVFEGDHHLNIHVLLDTTFFATSVPIGDQQRLLPVPAGKGLHVGDVVFLRDEDGTLTWVGDVLAGGETDTTDVWTDVKATDKQRHAIVGYLARIHPEALPRGTSKLSARWVTLNRRTLPGTLPWWDDHILVYHSTVRLIEGILTPEQAQQAEKRGYLNKHPSGHWTIPHGEARKRVMVEILDIELVCGLCGGPISTVQNATQDHIIPISQGGPDTLANVQLAHRECNELKGNALPEQYPPFFPQAGDTAAGWYGRSRRNMRGRGGRHARGRRGQTGAQTAAFQVEPRDIPAASATVEEEPTPKPTRQTQGKKAADGADKPDKDKAKATKTNDKPEAAKPKERSQKGPEPAVNGEAAQQPLTPEELQWLSDVKSARLERVQQYAREPQWAARTASLRTLEQLPRARAGKARANGTLLAEASGPKGRFRLLEWEDHHVLVEERGRRQTVHLVQMIDAIAPEAYVSYLTRFGRTSPLGVITALLPLWTKGKPDKDGQLEVTKGNVNFVIAVADDQFSRCENATPVTAS